MGIYSPMPIPPERWKRIEDIFATALDLPPEKCDAYLETACGDDAELRREVISLLAQDTTGNDIVAKVIAGMAASVIDNSLAAGTQLGPYRVLREIGHGGMGSIHLAVRTDESFEKRVAVKVVKRGMDTGAVLERFRRERRILAGLEHPYIARLLDGGTTPDGRPYFVMEFVEGITISEYCTTNRVGLKARCVLFGKICEAVAHAHRNLIVHRDLKPANILVTPDGTPKLLDFGIAKLLTESLETVTFTKTASARHFTPDYASPEQVTGEPITTATDVYSLGAVLFELLAGQRAHRFPTLTPLEIERVVCRANTARPSDVCAYAWRKELRGDLDNIVLMALRKDPQRRYSSVDQFRQDLNRWFDNLPVAAREETFGYRAGKFLQRHRWSVAAGALVVSSLAGGVVVATGAARRAEQQRVVAEQARGVAERERVRAQRQTELAEEQRRKAESEHLIAERQRDAATAASREAEQHAADLTELASAALFKVHEVISRQPGSLEPRRLIVNTTLESLDHLASRSDKSPRLLRTLALGYYRLGDLQGFPLLPNLGQLEPALKSYGLARTYLATLRQVSPNSLEDRKLWLHVESHEARVLDSLERNTEAQNKYVGVLQGLQPLVAAHPNDLSLLADRALASVFLSRQRSRLSGQGMQEARDAISDFERITRLKPGDFDAQVDLASGYANMALVLRGSQHDAEAINYYKKAVEIREKLLSIKPHEVDLKRDLVLSLTQLADKHDTPSDAAPDPASASAYFRRAISLAEQLLESDPSDRRAKSDLAMVLTRAASFTNTDADRRDSIPRLLRAVEITQQLLREAPKERLLSQNLTNAWQLLGDRSRENKLYDDAVRYLRLALDFIESSDYGKFAPGVFREMTIYRSLIRVFAEKGDRKQTELLMQVVTGRAAAILRSFSGYPAMERFPPSALMWVGDAYRTLSQTAAAQAGDLEKACDTYQLSADAWKVAASRTDIAIWQPLIQELAAKRRDCETSMKR